MRKQAEILGNSMALEHLRDIVSQRAQLGAVLSPNTGHFGIRAACPIEECGLSDKAGVRNRYLEDDSISFHCLAHGDFAISLHGPQQAARLELNTPMRTYSATDSLVPTPLLTGSRSLGPTTLASARSNSSGNHLRQRICHSRSFLSLFTARRFWTGPARSSLRACTWRRPHTRIYEAQTWNTC